MVANLDTDALMAGPLGQFLEEQRGTREAARQQARSRLFYGALICVPLMIAVMVFVPIEFSPKVWICGIAGAAVFAWTRIPIQEAKKQVKIGINTGIADALGMTYQADGEAGREFGLAKQFRLVPRHDRADLEDFWRGNLDGHAFLLHEAHCEERRGSGKNRRWVTVFRGAVIRIASGRKFHGTTLVKRPGDHDSWFGLGGRKDYVNFDGHRLDAVDMVHPDFADHFEVWSDDQVEARYLVDPLYVERLLALEDAFKGEDVCSLFDGGDIIVAVKSGNMFESGTMDPEEDRRMVEQCAAQLATMGALCEKVQKDFGFSDRR